MMIHWVKFKA